MNTNTHHCNYHLQLPFPLTFPSVCANKSCRLCSSRHLETKRCESWCSNRYSSSTPRQKLLLSALAVLHAVAVTAGERVDHFKFRANHKFMMRSLHHFQFVVRAYRAYLYVNLSKVLGFYEDRSCGL